MAVIVAGLVVLQHALDIRAVGAAWTARLGAVCAAIALGLVLGLALALLGSAVAVTTRLPRTLGWLMVLSGLAYLVQGWVLGTEGFSGTDTFAILGGYLLILAWITWLVALAWRTTEGHRGAAEEPVRAPGR
jgi:hypothetical protein